MKNANALAPRSPAVVVGAVALAYLLFARLALLLAIPPGYATPIWPAAGIALLAVIWCRGWAALGVWCGSTLANLLTASGNAGPVAAMVVASVIGAGAAGQALVARRLLDRAAVDLELHRARDILWFVTVSGPIACLVSASTGVACLWGAGVLSADAAAFSWLTWWVGDAIGAVLVGVAGLGMRPRVSESWQRRRITVAAPMAIAAAAMVFCYVRFSANEQRLQDLTFEQRYTAVSQALRTTVESDLGAVASLQALWSASQLVDEDEFRAFTLPLLASDDTILALEWVPIVPDAQRAAFEARLGAAHPERGRIFEMCDGRPVWAAARPVCYPVTYVEPLAGNEHAIGYDLGSDASRSAALFMAQQSGVAAATAPVRLLQNPAAQMGFLVIAPASNANAPAAADGLHTGYVLAVYRAGDLLAGAMHGIEATCRDLELVLRDVHAAPGTPALAVLRAGELVARPDPTVASGPSRQVRMDVAGRTWQLTVTGTADYVAAHGTWGPWAFLALALLGSCLLGQFLLFVTGQAAALRRLVAERTAALDCSNRELATRVAELDMFTSVASHDLQAPLRRLLAFCGQLRQDLGGELPEHAAVDLRFIEQSSARMRTLVRDLLSLSRIGKGTLREEAVPVARCLATVMQALADNLARSQATVTWHEMPVLRGDPLLLGQLFQNLIENAIKYQQPGVPPCVQIHAAPDGDGGVRLEVRDNGIGIDPVYREVVFQPFRRLHTQDRIEGSGIGLSICRAAVERHGGRIALRAADAGGTVFELWFPAERVLAMAPAAALAT